MKTTIFALLISVSTFLFASCENRTDESLNTLNNESSVISDYDKVLIVNDTATLSQEEIDGLLLMREEEKMAHDVYVTFYNQYKLRIFTNISNSESRHTEAVLFLIEAYGLTDPAINEFGVFSNPAIQDIYNQLVAKGTDEIEALKVGAFIEEYDIADLKKEIADTENENIIKVYESLMSGSENHLRAFVRNLSSRGVNYEPQILTEDEYSAIIND